MNSDGCAKGNPGEAGAGGLIRDARGQWLVAFTCDLGICTSVTAGIRLSLAWDEGYRLWFVRRMLKLESEFFSMATHPHGADCRSLLRRDWQCILHQSHP